MAWIAELENRGILRLKGPDRQVFLQGLVTNDVLKITADNTIYTLLLTPQGRFLYDLFISEVGDEWWIEADRQRLPDLLKRLSLYKLKSDVTLDIAEEKHVYAVWGGDVLNVFSFAGHPGATSFTNQVLSYVDPRLPLLGVRLVLNRENLSEFTNGRALISADMNNYRYHRYQRGVPETAEDLPIEKAIPLECGMNELNAIDWHKGCYMGQELTARTRYRGLVRKRLLPCRLMGPIELFSPLECQGQEVGEWRGICGDLGLALVRLEALGQPITANGIDIHPLIQDWMQLPTIDNNKIN